jgi:hypothetical protein
LSHDPTAQIGEAVLKKLKQNARTKYPTVVHEEDRFPDTLFLTSKTPDEFACLHWDVIVEEHFPICLCGKDLSDFGNHRTPFKRPPKAISPVSVVANKRTTPKGTSHVQHSMSFAQVPAKVESTAPVLQPVTGTAAAMQQQLVSGPRPIANPTASGQLHAVSAPHPMTAAAGVPRRSARQRSKKRQRNE